MGRDMPAEIAGLDDGVHRGAAPVGGGPGQLGGAGLQTAVEGEEPHPGAESDVLLHAGAGQKLGEH